MVKKLLILVAVGAIAGALIYKFYISKPIANVIDEKAAYTTTYDALVKELNTNDTATEKKYMDKTIEISGIVKSLNLGDSSSTITIGDTSNKLDIVAIFQIDSRNNATTKGLVFGMPVTLKGKVTGLENAPSRKAAAPTTTATKDGEAEGIDDLVDNLMEDVNGGMTLQLKDGAVIKKQ